MSTRILYGHGEEFEVVEPLYEMVQKMQTCAQAGKFVKLIDADGVCRTAINPRQFVLMLERRRAPLVVSAVAWALTAWAVWSVGRRA